MHAKTWMNDSLHRRFGRSMAVVALAATISLAAPAAIDAAPRDGRDIPACPTNARLIAGFNRGMTRLVADGDLSRTAAREARTTFVRWVAANDGAGCDIRDGMVAAGEAFFDYVNLSPVELRAGFMDGQSLAEMAYAATADEAEPVTEEALVGYLTGEIDSGLDRLEGAGALTPVVRDAIEERMVERVPFAVDFHRGDPLPEGHGKRR